MNFIVCLLIFAFSSSAAAQMKCSNLFRGTDKVISLEAQAVLDQFEFPSMAEISISDPILRKAIYDAFGGKDFYTQQPMKFEDMRIDHVIPKSKNGPDNIFNYVPTSQPINSKKSALFDPIAATALLSIVRTTFAPKVLKTVVKVKEQRKKKREARITRSAKALKGSPKKKALKKKPVSREINQTEIIEIEAHSPDLVSTLLTLKGFIEQNKDEITHGLEIFIPESKNRELLESNPDFNLPLALNTMMSFKTFYASGKSKKVGGSRLFRAMNSKEVSPGTHIVEVDPTFKNFIFETTYSQFETAVTAGKFNRDILANPRKVTIKGVSDTTIDFLKVVRLFGFEMGNGRFGIDIKRAIENGFKDTPIDFSKLRSELLAEFGGGSSRFLVPSLSGTTTGRRENKTLSDFTELTFTMPESFFHWMKSIETETYEKTLRPISINLKFIEFPPEVLKSDYN